MGRISNKQIAARCLADWSARLKGAGLTADGRFPSWNDQETAYEALRAEAGAPLVSRSVLDRRLDRGLPDARQEKIEALIEALVRSIRSADARTGASR